MRLRESLRIGWRSIRSHKLRSTLTTLGVIIGVAAVITFAVLGSGFTESIVGDIEADQQPEMLVQTQTEPSGGVGIVPVDTPIYTESDVEALEAIDEVAFVAPEGSLSVVQVVAGDERRTAQFNAQATTAERFEHDEFAEGAPFEGETEAVINERTATLFDENVSAGDELTVAFDDGSNATVTVAGVIDEDLGGGATPPSLYLPIDGYYATEIETPDGEEEPAYESLVVGTGDVESVEPAQEEVEAYLESESDASELAGEDEVIQVQTISDAIEEFTDIVNQLTGFVAGVAAIALVVGSIGIANIMIVSVTERTRQIGIMKAVGARRRDVVQLFLVESVVLGAIGAVVGVALGLGVGYLGTVLMDWPMAYPLLWIAVAILVGTAVGVVAGLYPAWRAARVDPIRALRHE